MSNPDLQQASFLRNQAQAAAARADWPQANQLLRLAIQFAPEAPLLRLLLGQFLAQQNDIDGATRSYFLAVKKARARGMWLDNDSVAPEMLPQVLAAMQFVELHRDEVLLKVLTPHENDFGKPAMARVRQALEIYLGLDHTRPRDPLQRPLFLYVPGLTETPYLDSNRFDWTQRALSARPQIAAEASNVLEERDQLEPFLIAPPGGNLDDYLSGSNQPPRWDAYFFYRHGVEFSTHLQACPNTAALLASLPRLHIPEHAPEVCFSFLAPGTRILPHTGVSNSRVVVHVPLILPGACALRVAGIERAWREDEVLIFDDTFEHEAWNHSTQVRAILLMDTWHPDLRPEERIALTDLITEIGRFNRG
jgi:aspartate beta-hydroxylase